MADAILRIKTVMDSSGVTGEISKIQSRLQGLKLPPNLSSKFEGSLKNIMSKYNEFQTLANKGVTTKGDFSKLNSSAKEVEASIRSLKKELNGITEEKLRVQVDNLPEVKALEKEIERLKKTYSELGNLGTNKIQGVFGKEQTKSIRELVGESKNLKPALENAFNAIKTGNIDEGLKALDAFEASLNKIRGGALNQFQKGNATRKSDIAKYIADARTELQQMSSGATEAKAKLEQLKTDRFNQMASGISAARVQLDNLGDSAAKSTREILNTARATQNMESQLSGLQTQANYFFGLQNMIQLFRRGLSDTIQTVRDLDKAMTDTAVVTDMTVSDLWAQLPDYTKLANKLGATTQGAYETMTLYYQQGLNKQETFEIGEETMKMARIAGLDYAQTTNMMTAALRGFNMELNQTSAKRVNDVYSELAAITASDTRELGLAMERTASIAHSANMDFGNTTAFLAQMIETTREAPENLGTAMKTIIARFQELKANPYEISEVEGEEVDFNRVDKALKSIGVDLMDNRDKFRDLDDVFLDISSKWDGLSQTQQRYVATIAAGARQQSRFLAMVQNYDRLKELTDAAANSEGASEVQFSKTLDSMEAKLNKLNNAWDQFAMGITNNELIKTGTGFLVKMLDAINKFETGIEHMGDHIGGVFGDLFKSITSFTGLLLGFKGLGKLTDIGIGMLGGMLGMGKGMKTSMFGGMSGMRQATNAAQAKAISSPIVAAINRLTEVVSKKPVETDTNIKGVGRQEFNNRKQQLKDMTMSVSGKGRNKTMTAKRFSVKDFGGVFKDLNREEQAALYRGEKGTREAIQKSFSEGVKKLKVSDEASRAADRFYTDLDYAMANGSHQVQSGLTKAFDPVKLGRAIGGDAGKEIEKAALERRKNIIKQGQQLGFNGQELKEYWQSREADLYGGKIKLDEDGMKANTSRLSGITSAANSVGSAFMQLGMTMQSIGFEKIGGIISVVGSSLLSMGMMAETASHGLKVLKTEATGVYTVLAGAAPALAIASGVLVAAFAAYKIKQKQIKDIRKSGKEVVSAYEDTTKSVQENLNKLSKYEADWGKWSAGVDVNGNNVKLGAEEYQDYKKAVKDIVKMHPELIKGYNAEGEAIIDNNNALKDAQKLEKERKETATQDYLKNGQKIIDRRNSTKRWQKGQENKVNASNIARGSSITAGYDASFQKSIIEKDAQAAADAIKKIDGSEEVLSKWGVTFDELGNITQDGINVLRQHGGDIQNELNKMFENPTEAQQRLLNGSNDTIAQLGQDFKGIEEVSKETFDALKVYATEQGAFKGLDENLIAPYQNALKRISEQDLSWSESTKAVDSLTKKYQSLGGHLNDFNEIQEKVRDAQDQFGKDLNMEAYQSAVDEATKDMDDWIIELRSSSDEANHILADWLENQKATFKNISESALTLSEAFNVHSGAIAAANAAYENWSKQNEDGDYYTAAEGFKKMVDEVNDGVDNLGKGSKQWWSAMTSILGEDYVFDHSKKEIESHMKTIKGFFEDGKEGAMNFMRYLDSETIQNKTLDSDFFEKGEKISDYIKQTEKGLDFSELSKLSPEQLSSLIKTSGMAEEAFMAAMNKAQQYYDIQAGDVDKMLTAIATGESTVLGNSGQKYMRESEFRREGIEATGDSNEVKGYQEQLTSMGVTFMKSASEISKKEMSGWIKDWGISTGQEGKLNQTTTDAFIKYFDKMGYNKDEISQLYETAGNLITDRNKVDYNEAYQTATESNQDPSVRAATNIDSNVSSILGTVQSIAGAMGILTQQDKSTIDSTAKELTKAANDILNGKENISNKDAQTQAQTNLESLEATKAMLEAGLSNYDDTNSDEYKAYKSSLELVDKAIEQNQQVLDTAKASLETLVQNRENADKTVEESKSEKLKSAYEDTAGEEKHLDISKLDTLITNVQESVKGSKEQNNVIGQYLQNSVKTLADNGANGKQIAESMRAAAQTMAEKGMKKEDIASALNQAYGTHLEKGDLTAEGNITAKLDQEELQAQLSNLQADVTANITQINVGGAAASGQNNPNSAFHRTGTMARGSRKGYTISGRPTLMGEEGEEVVWEPKRNEAYIVGSNGPQFGNISKEAVVWNAQQTKRIKKNSKTTGSLGTGARGITPIGTMKGGNAGGGGGMTIPGTFDINAMANVEDVIPPTEKPEIPVKGKLEIETPQKGGPLNKLLGKKESTSIKVTAEATKVNVGERVKAIKVTGDVTKLNNKAGNIKGIKGTAKVTKVTKSGKVTGEPIKVKASAVLSGKATGTAKTETIKTKADNTAQKDINSIKHKGAVLIKTKADNAAQRAINAIKGTTVTVHIKPTFDGSWTKNATVHVNTDAKGQNNYIAHRTTPSFGSAASGRYGKLGPKGKGGLTLTGEKGFEIAWIPRENRSMILGAQGPQMLMLPSDAVVWNHEQSKKILKGKQTIPAGSMWDGSADRDWNSGGGGSSSGSKKGKKHKKHYKKQKSGKKEQVREVITDGEISSKIFNLEQRIAQVKIKQEKAQKALNKQLEIAYNTLKDIKKNGNEDIKRLKQSAQLNQKLVNIYNNQLKTLDKSGDGKKKIEWTNPTEKRKKKGKKWGKWKSEGTKKHTASIDLGNYIKYDADTGAYVVQYEKINKAFGKDKNKAKAVKEAAEKEISEKTSKRDSAQSALDDANEKLAELGKQLYENFYSWKNELTKILEITKQIEAVQQQSERFKSALSLDETMAANFMKFGNSLDFFKAQLNSTIKEIDKRDDLINQQKETTLRAVSTEDERKEYNAVSDKIKKGEAARKKQEALTKAKNQVKADNDAIKARDTLLNKKDKKGKKTTLSKEENKRDAAAKKEKSLEKKKATLEKRLKSNKLSKKKRNKYEQELKSVKEDISKQKKIKNAAQKNIDIIKKGNKAEKDLQKHTDAQNTAQTKYNAVKNENLSDTEMLAEQERQKQLEEQLKIQTEAQKYVKPKINADGTLDVTIDEDALNKARDEGKISKELYEGIKAYYDNLIEESSNLGSLYDDQLKAFSDLHTTLKDLKEDYADKSEELLSAAEEADKNEIEQFEKLNSSLTDALKDLLDEVKTKLDERRKQEDNKKTEQDISKKQQRLAALRADTAGGHQVEIAQLEKEIAEAQQSYQRTLEDQLLDRLQTQADEAAKQRERQISLMNGQLEVAKATGSNVALINQYLSDPEHYSAKIEALWKAAKDYDNQTDARKDILDAEWESFKESLNKETGLPAQIDLTNQAITETAGKLDILKKALQDAADEINKKGPVQEPPKENPPEENPPEENPPEEKTFSLREGLNARPAIDEISEDGASLEQIQQALVKRYGSTENILKALSESDYSITDTRKYLPDFTYEQARQVYSVEALTKDSEFKDRANYDALLEKRKEEKSITSAQINDLFEYGQKLNKGKKQVLQEIMGGKGADPFTWDNTIKAVLGAKGINRWNLIKTFGDNSSASKAVQKHLKKKLKQIKAQKGWKTAKAFETGGLASYTGPAWLDGTPSKPELVLNAADTQNFLALKDVLSRAVNSSNSVSNSYGDATYEININVDHINNDYDVDRIAERVKKDIVKSAGYRNTTQVRNFR